MVSVDGFKVVQLKFSEKSSICSQLFWKPHNVRGSHIRKPCDCTLFILNVPSYMTKNSFQNIMRIFGKVQEVFFHKNPTLNVSENKFPLLNPEERVDGYKVGYVVFKDEKAVKKAMTHPFEEPLIASKQEKPIITGMKKWCAEYNARFIPAEVLQKEAEAIMIDYDERKAREKEARSREPDEEGWVTVTSKKRPAPSDSKGGSKRKRRKKTQIVNFYNFQQKETNMKHLEERRKKFEEDGKRMMMLRKSRKFKPL